MDQVTNRLVVYVDKLTGHRSYKNTKHAGQLVSQGLGHIEGKEPKEETKEVKQNKHKKKLKKS